MTATRRLSARAALLATVLVCLALLAGAYLGASAQATNTGNLSEQVNQSADRISLEQDLGNVSADSDALTNSSAGAAPGSGITVVATQGYYPRDERAELVAFTQDGSIAYFNNTYRVYFDVDPVPGERYTVEYVAAEHLDAETCQARFDREKCTRNVIERTNLTTGETNLVYEKVTPQVASGRWHDADRINDTHVAIADIVNDRLVVVDLRSGEETWEWRATQEFSVEDSGGKPADWTHINDVELVRDDWFMLSLRNHDQIVFVTPGEGMLHNWTIGSEDEHGVMFAQHNADYIPPAEGGPSVILADSHNNRIVEYHREDGEWTQTWAWQDTRLQWPRDGDRLPNGNTLVVDSNGDRVLEVNPYDRVVWNVSIGMPYDAERLGTGDESAGGPVASQRLDSATNSSVGKKGERNLVGSVVVGIKRTLPAKQVNGILFAMPTWMHFADLLVLTVLVVTLLVWSGAECYWSRYSLRGVADTVRARVARLR